MNNGTTKGKRIALEIRLSMRAVREEMGFDQRIVAKKIYLSSPDRLSRIETGKSKITLEEYIDFLELAKEINKEKKITPLLLEKLTQGICDGKLSHG